VPKCLPIPKGTFVPFIPKELLWDSAPQHPKMADPPDGLAISHVTGVCRNAQTANGEHHLDWLLAYSRDELHPGRQSQHTEDSLNARRDVSAEIEMSDHQRDIYHSENGDRWFLCRGDDRRICPAQSQRVVGRITTKIELSEFSEEACRVPNIKRSPA
jgi:hypothetical protein